MDRSSGLIRRIINGPKELPTHVVAINEPNGSTIGDEYYNPSSNQLFKRLAVNGTDVQWVGQLQGTAYQASGLTVASSPRFINFPGGILSFNATTGVLDITSATTGTVTSVGGTGTVNGITLTGTVTSTGNLTLGGTLSNVSLTTQVSRTLPAANGGTGQSSYAVGDLLYASTTTAVSKLADVATGNALISGGVGVAPAWGKVGLTTHISGTLPIANGGTNSTATATNGGIGYGTGTAHAYSVAGTSGYILKSNGAAAPTWTINDLTSFPTSNYKKSVRVATTANITLSAPQTIDGIAVVAGNRVLVKNQTLPAQNGIYIVAAAAWTRSVAADGSTEIDSAVVGVDEGTANGGKFFTNIFKSTDVVGTTVMPWYEILTSQGISTTLITAGTLPIARGGTNATATPTNGAVAYGTGTAYAFSAAGTSGYILKSNGAAAPTWTINDLTLFPTSNYKKSVRVATTANITLSAPQTIDGIAVVAGNRVLVKNQTTTAQNGIYIVAAAAWTRSVAADGSTEIDSAVVGVDEGTANGGKFFTNVFKSTDVVGTTAMPWYQVVYETGKWAISISGTAAVSTAATATISSTASAFKMPFLNTTANTTGNYGILQDSVADFTYNPSINIMTVGGIQCSSTSTFSVNNAVTAAGTTQGTAFAIATDIVNVTVGVANSGVRFPYRTPGHKIIIRNSTAVTIKVYPNTSAQINIIGLNVGFDLTAATTLEFVCFSATQWYTLNATFA